MSKLGDLLIGKVIIVKNISTDTYEPSGYFIRDPVDGLDVELSQRKNYSGKCQIETLSTSIDKPDQIIVRLKCLGTEDSATINLLQILDKELYLT